MNQTAELLHNVDIRTVDINTLVDIRDVKINPDLPWEVRIKMFLEQIKNPYCYRYGNAVVKIGYDDNGPSLEDRLEEYISGLVY